MRATILSFLLIISICHQIGLAEEQPNLKPHNANNRIKSVGQAEYYIPVEYNTLQQQQQQEFLYPNNVRNLYQYPYNHVSGLPSISNRLWASNPIFSGADARLRKYKTQNIKSVPNNQYDSSSNNQDNQDLNRLNVRNTDNFGESDGNDNSAPIKVKDFNLEQKKFKNAKNAERQEYDYKDSQQLLSAVMRRKSAINDNNDNSVFSAALQSGNGQSLPVPLARQQSNVNPNEQQGSLRDVYFVAIVACLSAVAIFGTVAAGYCFYKVQQSNKAAADVDYPAYGVVGPATKETGSGGNVSPSGDRKLAQSAQMYHYHHQKQQMIASEKAVTNRNTSASDVESDEENEEGEYTVYECPGLAPTGEMEVKNPLFHDDITPVSSPPVTANTKEK